MTTLPRVSVLLAFPVLAVLTGCSGGDRADAGKFVAKGKLVEKGKPFSLDPARVPLPPGATALPPGMSGSAALQVVFIPVEGGEEIIANTDAATGTFEVAGPDGKGIKPARYKIAVTGQLGFGPDTPDFFKGKFTPEKTQILRDVREGEEILIDVARPQG